MSMLAFILVLLAALVHAGWNVAAKKTGGDWRYALLVSVFVVLVWSPVALWFGWNSVPNWAGTEWRLILASAVVHLLYFTILLKGYEVSDLTVVYPVARGSAPLISVFGAALVLNENIDSSTVIGALLVTLGILLIAGGPALWSTKRDPNKHEYLLRGVLWGAASGAFIAGYTLIDGYAVKVISISPLLLDYFGNALRVPFLLPSAIRHFPELRTAWVAQWKSALFVALISPIGYVLVLYAMTLAPLSHVAPARELSTLLAALVGGRLLGESDRLLRLSGAACVASGVMLLALG